LGRACEEKVNDSDLQHSNLGRDTRESAAVSQGTCCRGRGVMHGRQGRQTPFARCTPDGACGRGRPAAEQEHTYHAPNHTSHLAIPIRFPVAGPHRHTRPTHHTLAPSRRRVGGEHTGGSEAQVRGNRPLWRHWGLAFALVFARVQVRDAAVRLLRKWPGRIYYCYAPRGYTVLWM
jgi:hypothetical protein